MIGLAVLMLIPLAGCGGGDDTSEEPTTGPRAIERDGTTIVVPTPAPQATFATSNLDADGDGYLVYAELEQAIRRTMPTYDWPAAYHPTTDDILNRFSGGASMEGHGFEVGLEHTLIDRWHMCAWYQAWLDAFRSGDADAQAAALTVMTDVLPYSPIVHQTVRESRLNIAQQAALGDPALVQKQLGYCGMSFPSPPATPAARIDPGSYLAEGVGRTTFA